MIRRKYSAEHYSFRQRQSAQQHCRDKDNNLQYEKHVEKKHAEEILWRSAYMHGDWCTEGKGQIIRIQFNTKGKVSALTVAELS